MLVLYLKMRGIGLESLIDVYEEALEHMQHSWLRWRH